MLCGANSNGVNSKIKISLCWKCPVPWLNHPDTRNISKVPPSDLSYSGACTLWLFRKPQPKLLRNVKSNFSILKERYILLKQVRNF